MKFWLLFFISLVFYVDFAASAVDQQDNGGSIVINEIHYDPDIKTELVEFIELHNTSPDNINITGWYFCDGISYRFPEPSILPAGGYIILAQDPTSVRNKWRTIPKSLIYGPFEGKLDNNGEKIELCDAYGEQIDEVDYQLGFPWPTVGDPITDNQPGTGYSIQLINPTIDNDLGGSWRSASPTPAAYNGNVYTDNPPAHIRQVEHSPKQPASNEVVTITAKVTDSDGVAQVTLLYQIVDAGSYIPLFFSNYSSNPDYENPANWSEIPMLDDGLNADQTAGDEIYTVQLPASLQVHRRLIRYRIAIEDNAGHGLTVPYPDDPQPNFAYFVYDGVPAWSGAVRPGVTPVIEYSTDVMRSLPVYHLIGRKTDVENCTWYNQISWTSSQASEFKWCGTMVYDGEVYDHIRFRTRGGTWRYAMGKNMWKFNFNRGHSFQARDDYGRKYDTKWDKLNFSACIQQGNYLHRGEQGMFEAVSFKLFNLMGCEASKTNWLHFRIIDEAVEAGPTQYDGDFWGLYMTIEQLDGRFLDEHNLPDGNLYRMNSQSGHELNNQGSTAATDWSDLYDFMNGYQSRPGESWWRGNVNLESYYAYRCVVEGVHHGDIGYGKNYSFYLNPETNLWSQLPWDLDLTWAENMYGNGEDPFKGSGRIFSNYNIEIEYQNRLREFQDLLYNTDQMSQLLDDLANIIDPSADSPTFVDADRAMWDYNPIMISGYVNSSKAGQGRFYQQSATGDFRGMVQLMKDYVVYVTNNTRNWHGSSGPSMNELAADPLIPDTPVVTATCPVTYPANELTFETSPFGDPQGAGTFAAMEWRIAEVSPDSQIVTPQDSENQGLLLISDGEEWKYFKGTQEPSQTPEAWRLLDFDDSAWSNGRTSIGYGDNDDNTVLNDMQNNYSSVYLRYQFDMPAMDELDTLKLNVYVDDGCIIWINGVEVARLNVSDGYKAYDDLTGETYADNAVWEEITLPAPYDYLIEGQNVMAIHVLNNSLSSSDLSIDVTLTAETNMDNRTEPDPSDGMATSQNTRGIYEINAAWESDEITGFDSSIKIPAGLAQTGHTYRVRCRMKDNTGRWSHWSAPIQFEAGQPNSDATLTNLRITELMYNPSMADTENGEPAVDNENFEFVELKNIGPEDINLNLVSFSDGIDFTFSDIELKANEYAVIVKDQNAFISRYGPFVDIAGQYSGKLDNNGERIRLQNAYGQTILDFRYEDNWYDTTDGGGFSLTIVDPANPDPNSWSLKENWRASHSVGGSPDWED